MIAVFDVLPPAFGSSALGPDLATFVPIGCGEVVGLEDPVGLTDPFPDLASSLKAVTFVTLVDFPPPRLVGLDEIVGLDDAFPCFSSCFPLFQYPRLLLRGDVTEDNYHQDDH